MSTIEILGETVGQLDVKRLYLPGIVITQTCPRCNHVRHRSYGKDSYLGYPDANRAFLLPCHCQECDHEWEETVILRVLLHQPGAMHWTNPLLMTAYEALHAIAQMAHGETENHAVTAAQNALNRLGRP